MSITSACGRCFERQGAVGTLNNTPGHRDRNAHQYTNTPAMCPRAQTGTGRPPHDRGSAAPGILRSLGSSRAHSCSKPSRRLHTKQMRS